MKKSIFFIFLITLILISGCIKNQQSSNYLPSDFTITINQDSTSSGASREHTMDLVFENNELTEGSEKYYFSSGYRTNSYECKYDKESRWKDEQDRECKYGNFQLITEKETLQEKMNDGEFLPDGDQGSRGAFYYRIE